MGLISARRIAPAAAALGALILLAAPAMAQPGGTTPAPTTPTPSDPDRNSPANTVSFDAHMVIRSDLTATVDSTVRFKILRESAIRTLGQQTLSYVESLNPLEIIEAYTEKADGKKIAIDPTKILTRDAATGLNAVYQRDAKVKTLIFPDIEVGDTLVYVSKTNRIDRRFPGLFSFQATFPRSVPYGSYRLTVDEPKSLALRIAVDGDGVTHAVTETDTSRQHVFGFRPSGWALEEPGAISFLDRDPRFLISTFKDVSELAASYWESMKDRDVIDPEIQALADDLTKGIEDRRAQAVAIDHWVKKNIRYVLVFLGSGGITPNPPLAVLKNKYGDCKDHVALMGALLRAKGIASEQVLISLGNSYRLPELPMPSFNHVMLYLPDFGLYTDPTASYASFGTLPESSYDKPVLHISSAGGRPARTPPMKPDDHVTIAKTTATIAADGTIKGTTRQTATGIFASSARGVAMQIQTQGREKSAEAALRNLGQAGTGLFEPAAPFDFAEPYILQGEFALNTKLEVPLNGPRQIPFGMPIHRRPSVGLLGQRVPGRRADFMCFAGKQVEEIELTFADGLPLPRAINGGMIDNKYFSYQSHYAINGRTMTIRREFTSNVTGQVCAKEIESELTEPLQRVARSMQTQMSFQPIAPSKDPTKEQ
jgi:transglutaminase-like putative cysteine protease